MEGFEFEFVALQLGPVLALFGLGPILFLLRDGQPVVGQLTGLLDRQRLAVLNHFRQALVLTLGQFLELLDADVADRLILVARGQVAELAGRVDELDGVPDRLVEFKVEGVQPTTVADALQIKLFDGHGLDLVVDPATKPVTGYDRRDFKVGIRREQLIAQMLHAGALVELLDFNPVLKRQGPGAVGEDVHVGQAGVAAAVAVVGRVEREIPFKHAIQAVEPVVLA